MWALQSRAPGVQSRHSERQCLRLKASAGAGWRARVRTIPHHAALTSSAPILPAASSVVSSAASASTAAPPATPSPPPASSPGSATVPATTTTSSTSASNSAGAAPYNWFANWVPIVPTCYLDPARPTPVTTLGQPLVLWHHKTEGWRVMRDMCPHRLAPLSEGRVEEGGTRLACAYHGWEFDGDGRCTRVPQLAADPRAAATARGSPRSCLTSFPVRVHDGVLWAWLEAGPGAAAAAAATPLPRLLDAGTNPILDWSMNELPNDYSFWVEQGMDPTHANFLHHGLGAFRSSDSVPMRGGLVRNQDIDIKSGWTWQHRGYEVKNQDMEATRDFQPPFVIRATYDQPNGSRTQICTMQVPVRPGVCRTFFKLGVTKAPKPAAAAGAAAGAASAAAEKAAEQQQAEGKKEEAKKGEKKKEGQGSGIFGLIGKIPHWLFMSQLIADQDVVMMCRQEQLMRSEGLTRRDYWLNSRSDEGVAAINKWMKLAGYPTSLWGGSGSSEDSSSVRSGSGGGGAEPAAAAVAGGGGGHDDVGAGAAHSRSRTQQLLSRGGAGGVTAAAPPLGQTYGGWPAAGITLEQMLSRRERHVRHCVVCQRGEVFVGRVCVALTAAAALVAAGTVVAALVAALGGGGVAAVGGWRVLAAAAAGSAALVLAAVKAWAFKDERFVSGLRQWQKNGGYAMVGIKGAKDKYKIQKPKKQ
ncbi:hypothetical protein HYH02_000211 [Chlamydomonas schloesseri]|uniref:Rieske domain-containing protein n=1 Tax=Chlamydomonas schloesseri TaxID=2026947 RepID=A0A835WMS9_9CHLO|nr:hypothetical protein HYH02_000211 [Chlamydomonas schloesseri]|eukprot:KAG2450108.1 hypothetical protein HYH02_000211 [Chlamydomonas schloesseri]